MKSVIKLIADTVDELAEAALNVHAMAMRDSCKHDDIYGNRVQTMTHHHSEGISGILASANIYEIQMVTLQKAFRSGSRKPHLKLKQCQTDN